MRSKRLFKRVRNLLISSFMGLSVLVNFASADECLLKVGVVPQFEQRRLLAT